MWVKKQTKLEAAGFPCPHLLRCYILATQGVVPGSAAKASLGCLIEMQSLVLRLRNSESEYAFQQDPRDPCAHAYFRRNTVLTDTKEGDQTKARTGETPLQMWDGVVKGTHAKRDDQGEWLSVFSESRQGKGRSESQRRGTGKRRGQVESPFMALASK